MFGKIAVWSDKLPEIVTDLALRYDGDKSMPSAVTQSAALATAAVRDKKFHPGQ